MREGGGREERIIEFLISLMNTYFLIFVLALICDCVLPLLRPGSSSLSTIIMYTCKVPLYMHVALTPLPSSICFLR